MTTVPRQLPRWQIGTTTAILGLAAGSALLGLVRAGHYRGPPDIVEAYRAQDLAILVVGIPVLAVGLWFAARGSPRGRITWLGGLAFMTYIWASIALQVPFNELFLVYIALFGLSLFTLVGGLVRTDAERIRQTVAGRINVARYSGALAIIGLGLGGLWLSDVLPSLLGGTTPTLIEEAGPQAMATHVIDLGVVVPSILLAAVWLYQERAWGFVLAGVELVLGATLAAPIGIMTAVFLTGGGVQVSPIAAALTLLPIVVSAVLAVTYLRSMAPRPPLSADGTRQRSR